MQQQSLLNVWTTRQKHPGLFPFPGCTVKIRASENADIVVTSFASSSAVSVGFKTLGEVKWGTGSLTQFSSTAKLEPETTNFVVVWALDHSLVQTWEFNPRPCCFPVLETKESRRRVYGQFPGAVLASGLFVVTGTVWLGWGVRGAKLGEKWGVAEPKVRDS